ncbi:MAG: hypothetical protein AAF961_19650, partial [Planctomycetota bacterium]
ARFLRRWHLGYAPGNRWEVVNGDEFQAFEAFLFGATEIAPGESLRLGTLYDAAVGEQDLDINFTAVFSDRFEQFVAQSTDAKSTTGEDVFLPVEIIFEAIESSGGDFDGNGIVDGADFILWQRTDGSPEGLLEWETNFGNVSLVAAGASLTQGVPETSHLGIAAVIAAVVAGAFRRRRT